MRELPLLQITQQVLHTLHETLATRFHDAVEHDRVGCGEVGGAQRFGHRLSGEFQLFALTRIDMVHLFDHREHALRQQQVGLVNQREDRLLAPAWVGKSTVFAGQGRVIPFAALVCTRQHQRLPKLRTFRPPALLFGRIGERELRGPVLEHGEPFGRIARHHFARRLECMVLAELDPHGLHTGRVLGPFLQVCHRRRGRVFTVARCFGQRGEHHLGPARLRFQHRAEGIVPRRAARRTGRRLRHRMGPFQKHAVRVATPRRPSGKILRILSTGPIAQMRLPFQKGALRHPSGSQA